MQELKKSVNPPAPAVSGHASAAAPASSSRPSALTPADIRRNMILLVLIDSVWLFGNTEMNVAANPLYVHLKASNTMMGLITGTGILGIIGILLSPFITVRFPVKKVYLFCVHIPYLLPWGLIGLGIIFSRQLALESHGMLMLILIMMAISNFAAGFVTLPHQEYIAACIPMSHRGRLSGYGNGIGSGLAIISNSLAGWMLLVMAKPAAYGYLFVMTWIICQAGYIFALFAREVPTPVDKAPKPWSRTMVKAVLHDRPYLRVVALQALYYLFFLPLIYQFIAVYGLNELGMAPATSAVIGVTQRTLSLLVCGYLGHLIDRYSPRRFMEYLPLGMIVSLAPLFIWHHPYAVYASLALGQLVHVGQYGSFNAMIFGLPAPENRAGHFTFQILVVYLTSSLGPVLIGRLCDVFSYRTTFLVVLGVTVLLIPVSRYLLAPLSTRAQDYD